MDYIYYYIYVIIFFWIINAIIGGYQGEKWTFRDFIDCVVWPISLSTLVGLLIRIIVQKLNKDQNVN